MYLAIYTIGRIVFSTLILSSDITECLCPIYQGFCDRLSEFVEDQKLEAIYVRIRGFTSTQNWQ